jgi:hypothetical protein
VELSVALALALTGRGDAYVAFAKTRGPGALADRRAAERDYDEGVRLLESLAAKGAIEGTDLQSLTNARAELARLRRELAKAD